MPRTFQVTSAKSANSRSIASIGDSHTHNFTLGMIPTQFYPHLLEDLLLDADIRVSCFNHGVSGNTSAQMIPRVETMYARRVPEIAVIYCGTNDDLASGFGSPTVQASPAPTPTTFSVTAGKGQYLGVGSTITVGGVAVVVLSVATDAITLTAPRTGGAPTAGMAVVIDTQANLIAAGTALRGAGVTRCIVLGQHMYNYSTLTDTIASPYAPNVALRVKQEAAATAVNALDGIACRYVDLWDAFAAEITAGRVVAGSYSWHVLDQNVHLNESGEALIAAALLADITAAGWLTDLT